jgi:hypothetical protein
MEQNTHKLMDHLCFVVVIENEIYFLDFSQSVMAKEGACKASRHRLQRGVIQSYAGTVLSIIIQQLPRKIHVWIDPHGNNSVIGSIVSIVLFIPHPYEQNNILKITATTVRARRAYLCPLAKRTATEI